MAALVFFLYALGVRQGLSALIQTQRDVMAAAGEQVCLNCQLTVHKDVHEVTWQKIQGEVERNVASVNKGSVSFVFPEFSGKVKFEDAGLQNSSILIMEVTEQDEGCYRCLVNVYPDRPLNAITCLQVYELYGPVLHVTESDSSEQVTVSCSATGRPAPTVTITTAQTDFSILNKKSASFLNNRTVTIIQTAVLSRHHDNSSGVSCAAQVSSVPQKEVFEMIPEVRLVPTARGSEEESEVNSSGLMRLLIFALVISLIPACSCALIFFRHKRRKCLSQEVEDPEVIQTPQRPAETQNITPLIRHQDEKSGVKQRSSVLKGAGTKSPRSSSVELSCRRGLSRIFSDINSPGEI